MKKTILAAVAAVAITASAGLSATGIGPQIDSGVSFVPGSTYVPNEWGAACSAKFDSMPVYWALSTDAGYYEYKNSDASSGWTSTMLLTTELTGDYWMMNKEIHGIWRWYWGLGGAVSTALSSDGKNMYFTTGPRGVIGMNWHFCDGFLELYTQGAVQPEIQFAFGEDGTKNGIVRLPVRFPFNVGLRFWF